MSKHITIQLPANLEQYMLHEADTQNITLEHLVLGLIQRHYGIQPASINSLEDFFNAIRNAIETGQSTVQAPVNDLYLQMAESLKRNGTLLNFQTDAQYLTLYINPTPPPPETLPFPDIDPAGLDPELAKIFEDLQHGDETTRSNAIQAITQWYAEQSQ